MDSEQQSWERLIAALSLDGSAEEVAPGRVVVTQAHADEPDRVVEIVMTHREWDDMASVIFGDADSAAAHVRDVVGSLGSEDRYLVYETYDLVPSATPELPDDEPPPGLARAHLEGGLGWYADARRQGDF